MGVVSASHGLGVQAPSFSRGLWTFSPQKLDYKPLIATPKGDTTNKQTKMLEEDKHFSFR